MAQNAGVFGGGAFGSKSDKSILRKIGGDVSIAVAFVPFVKQIPVIGREIVLS